MVILLIWVMLSLYAVAMGQQEHTESLKKVLK